MKRISLQVSKADAGQRLDKYLAARSGLSRGACRRAIGEGGVWLRGQRLRRLSLEVEEGWTLDLVVDERARDTDAPAVIFEDSSVLVVNKPPGLPTQGTLATDQRTVLGWGQFHAGRPLRTVHRLDVGTSGALVLAKTTGAAAALGEQFRLGAVEKRYIAIGVGSLSGPQGRLMGHLRSAARRGSSEVCETGGVPAETEYRVLATKPPLQAIEAIPRTGRTHQIRVHLSHAGAPLLGDSRYGGPSSAQLGDVWLEADRPLLHAARLAFAHPVTNAPLSFEAAPPEDLARILTLLGVET